MSEVGTYLPLFLPLFRVTLERPKSVSLIWPSLEISILSGFKSLNIQKANRYWKSSLIYMLKYQMGVGGWGIARGNAIIFFKIEVLMSGSVKSRKQSSKPSITYWNLQKIIWFNTRYCLAFYLDILSTTNSNVYLPL